MMRYILTSTCRVLMLAGVLNFIWLACPQQAAQALILRVGIPSILSITNSKGSFALVFEDFSSGSESSEEIIGYEIQANNFAKGFVDGAVAARIDAPLDGLTLQAKIIGYSHRGQANFGRLIESDMGFQEVSDQLVALADKRPGRGAGDLCLEGLLQVAWKAKLSKEAPSGDVKRILIVTLRDGY